MAERYCAAAAPIPANRDRAALRADALPTSRIVEILQQHGVRLHPWQERLAEHVLAHRGRPLALGRALVARRRARHALPDVLPSSFARDLAAADFSLPTYFAGRSAR